jgi:hypothetical protein
VFLKRRVPAATSRQRFAMELPMCKRTCRWIRALLVAIACLAPAMALAQDEWFVWEQSSPCVDSRQDWFTVAQDYPGGNSAWEEAEGPFDSFAAAMAAADGRKQGPRFPDFRRRCCDDWAVLRSDAGGTPAFSVAKLTPGSSFPFGTQVERGGLCCEEAFEAAGLSAAGQNDCRSLRLADGSLVTQQNGQFTRATNPTTGSGSFGQINQAAGLDGKALRFYGGSTPEQCQADCENDPACQGYTFMRAGAHLPSDPDMCYLMEVATRFTPSPCCVSGIRGPATGSDAGGGPVSDDPCVCKSRCSACDNLPSLLCQVAGGGPQEQACQACMARCE